MKLGPKAVPDEVLRLLDIVDPANEPGKVTLITRHGASKVAEALPPMVRAIRRAGRRVVWSSDPMHGNTVVVNNFKTREFGAVLSELTTAFEVHRAEGGELHGVHLELTGDNITECIGGAEGLNADDLARSYETGCDPRLNYSQSMEIAFLITRLLHRREGVTPREW